LLNEIEFCIAHNEPWDNKINIHIRSKNGIAEPLLFKPICLSTTKPTMSLERKEAQDLMNRLWDAGIRPVQGKGSAGQLEATEKHLEDMRTLVFRE